MVFAEVLAQKSIVLACQPRSSMMNMRQTDVSTTEAYYIIVERTETPAAMEKLETALGKKWAKKESHNSSKLQNLIYLPVNSDG